MDAAVHWARGGKPSIDEAVKDMEVLGLPPEAIEDLKAAHAKEDAEDFGILPENWPTVQAWMRVQTQWRVAGMGTVIGLDYSAVDVALRRARIEDPEGEIFAGLQVMEVAALEALQD